TECGEVVSSKTAIIPAKGHATVIDPAVPATCTQSGLTQGSHCSVCNEVIVAQQVVKALGHLERMVPGYAATYISEGLTDGIFCDRCNEWVVPQVVIPKLKPAHLIGDVNRDGNVDVLDAVLVQKYSASKATLDDEQLYIGDVNDDGTVDILDAVQIQKYAGEKIFEFKKKA
ncbi:MAG: dockerin type I repeat-containing protein, partial [Selenomonadaceae bacterium]|nr:dockerin type I repeat-containing protein [Selenomonadaceae bacterium]